MIFRITNVIVCITLYRLLYLVVIIVCKKTCKHDSMLVSEACHLGSSIPLKLDISNIRFLRLKSTNINCSIYDCLILFSAQDLIAGKVRQMTTQIFGQMFVILSKHLSKIGLDLQPVCSHLSHCPCHHVLG